MKKVLFSLLLSTVTCLSFASPGSWMTTGKTIKNIIVDDVAEGIVLVTLEGDVPSEFIPEACRDGSASIYNTIELSTEKGQAMYSMALAAYMAGKPVKLALSCIGTRPLITHMQL